MHESIKISGVDFRLSTRMVNEVSWNIAYHKGWREPNHQVPAIMQHFEFGWYGWSLIDSQVVLLHVIRGSYPS